MKWFHFVLVFVFLFSNSLFSSEKSEVKIQLQFIGGDVCLSISNPTPNAVTFSNFRRVQNFLVLVVFQDGELVPDKYWQFGGNRSHLFSSGYTFICKARSNRIVFLDLIGSGRFPLDKNGRYYIACLAKAGSQFLKTEDYLYSNIISMDVKDKKSIQVNEARFGALPKFVADTLNTELASARATGN